MEITIKGSSYELDRFIKDRSLIEKEINLAIDNVQVLDIVTNFNSDDFGICTVDINARSFKPLLIIDNKPKAKKSKSNTQKKPKAEKRDYISWDCGDK